MYKSLLILFLLFFSVNASAQVVSENDKKMLKQLTLENFWGNAIGHDGKKIEPKDDKERKKLPISDELANATIEAGALSGIADWCGLNWEKHFDSYMSMRRSEFKDQVKEDKKIAFIGMLHGATQGYFYTAMKDSKTKCDKEAKNDIKKTMENKVELYKTFNNKLR